MSDNPLLRYLTKRELELAQEYEASTDPERRDAIRRELYNLRWKLNSENDRKYNTTGKGRHNTAMCEGCLPAAAPSCAPSRQKKVALPKKLKHATPTLEAIMRNGSDRARSIRELSEERNCSLAAAKFKYFADRNSLMEYFSVRPN